MLFLDTSSAAAWSSFGLILAVLVAFTAHYYWKKNKETSGKTPIPTSDGYDNLSFQKVLDANEELKGKLKEEEQKHNELKIEHAALQEREKSLNSNNQALTNELNQLKGKHDFFQDQNTKLEKEKAELTQQVITREDQIKEKGDRLLERQSEIKDLMDDFSDLEEELKDLKVDNKKLSTEKLNLSDRNDRLEKELEKFKGDLKNLQEERTQLLSRVTGLTHEKQKYLDEKEQIKEQYQKSWVLYEELRNRGISVQVDILEGYKRFKEDNEELVRKAKAEEEGGGTKKGVELEVWWGEEAKKLFSAEDRKYVEFESQPGNNLDGKKGDFRITFRDDVNSFSARRQLNIYIEHKYASKQGERVGDVGANIHPQMNKDLKKALEDVKKSRHYRKYDFLFFITNRAIGKEDFRERQFYLLETDEDYKHFGLDVPKHRYDKELKIVILTGKKALRCLWSLYMLWRLWMPKNITITGERVSDEILAEVDNFLEASTKLHDGLSEEMVSKWTAVRKKLDSVIKFWSEKEEKFKNMSIRAIDLRSKFSVDGEAHEVEIVNPNDGDLIKSSTPHSIGESNSSEKVEEEVLTSSQTIKDNSVSEITSKVNIEQPEVRDNLSSST